MDIYKQIWDKIKEARSILLVAHVNPDGDALGSELSLYPILKKMGKKVTVYNATKPLPQYLDFLPNFNKITDKLPAEIDLAVSFDCGSFDRLGLEEKPPFLINIDHHIPSYFEHKLWKY